VFSARSKADKRGVKCNRAVGQGESTPTNKHVRNTDKNCSNTHCGAPRGHLFKDCIAYGGGSQGKYTELWKGLWNIHLPLEQQNRANNVLPTNHPASGNNNPAAQKATVFYMHDGTTSCSQSSDNLSTTDDGPHVCTITAAEKFSDLWNTHLNNELIIATLPILETIVPHNDHCYYDSGANQHIFNDRSAFNSYKVIKPLTVKGFSHELTTLAVGQGTVLLQPKHADTQPILLSNILHIPAAWSNLVSSIQLTKHGIVTTLGHSAILSH
jgi:Pol polyprotein, beta-barrel domain